jgi:hypothetical protein
MDHSIPGAPDDRARLSYVVTVSRRHLLPACMGIETLRMKTDAPIVVVGNLEPQEAARLQRLGADYIDEGDIDTSGRMPSFSWDRKYREVGWYRQMFYRLCVDRYVDTPQAVILDSEVFVFDNWDESRLYDPATGHPRCFYWVPAVHKPEMDYRLYRGAAYLLKDLPGFEGVVSYAGTPRFRRHISGVVLFSTANVRALWSRLEAETDLATNLDDLFNHRDDLSFSDHDFYGIAADYHLFDDVVPTVMHRNLLGWYDNHEDPEFDEFRRNAMWSMCQRYFEYPTEDAYREYMKSTARSLGAVLPGVAADPPEPASAAPSGLPATALPGPWVLVVGMHRGGTSAVTGGLAQLGMALPPEGDLIRGMPDNPVHYESASLNAVNDGLLEALGGSWSLPPDLPPGWEHTARATGWDERAVSAAGAVFPGPGPNVLKDPRLCALLPYWRRLLGGPVAAVLVWRPPMAVARSLTDREGFPLAHSLALWELSNRQALAGLEGLPVFVLGHRDLLGDPAGTFGALAGWLDEVDIRPAGGPGWDVEKASGVISSKLSHFDDGGPAGLVPEQVELVARLRAAGGPHTEFHNSAGGPLSDWSSALLGVLRKLSVATDMLSSLSLGTQELSDAHQELIGAHHELLRVSDERVAEIQNLHSLADDRLRDNRSLTAELQAAEERAAWLHQQIEILTKDRDEWQQGALRAIEELEQIRDTASWRITAPLRAIRPGRPGPSIKPGDQ